MFTRTLAAVVAVLALSTPAFAADPGNLTIFRDVQKKVLGYTQFTIFDSVNTRIDNGVVTLIGKVTMPYKKDAIERRVREVDGVTRVINQIDVLPVSRFDDELRVRIARAIYSNPAFRGMVSRVNPPIHVIVENGRVTLEGVVLNQVDRQIAHAIASQFLSFAVTNALKTEAEVQEELERL